MKSDPYLIAAFLSALVYWWLTLRPGYSAARTAIKGMALLPLIPMAVSAGSPSVALALLLCSLGDMILSRPGEKAFLGGLIAFAMGHLGWMAVFVAVVGVSAATLADFWLLGALVLALAVGLAAVMLPRTGALRGPVVGYIAVIVAMTLTALATGNAWIMAGAFLFMASDALLGLQTFVLVTGDRPERIANALIWPLYWSAVVFLTLAALGV